MSDLAEKIRQSRRVEIAVGKMKFYGRRPSVEEYAKLYNENTSLAEVARKFIDGWDNVKEKDLFKGGSDELVEFDKELWSEAVGDLLDVYTAISNRLIEEANKHLSRKEANKKNL